MHHQHREKLLSLFEANQPGIIYLEGAQLSYRYGTDYEYPFRQESNFWYLTGIIEPDCHQKKYPICGLAWLHKDKSGLRCKRTF